MLRIFETFKYFFLFMLSSALLSSSAYTMGVRGNFFGILDYPFYSSTGTLSILGGTIAIPSNVVGSLGFGAGGTLEMFFQPFSVETGALLVSRRYEFELDAGDPALASAASLEGTHLMIPLGARFYFLSYLSLGAGGYYSKKLSGDGITDDFGILGGLRVGIPVSSSFSVLLEPLFYMGFKKDSNNGKAKGLMGLLGVSFGGGK